MKKLIIFDLDGTLLNTIADLAECTNYALKQNGFPIHPEKAYNFFVGNGINKLFERALPKDKRTKENILHVREAFLSYYGEHNTDKSTPYPGIPELLTELYRRGILLAVASNKYHEGTRKLISFFFPEIPFVAVLGQREEIAPKPDPTIINDILSLTNVPKENVLYVGDSGVDMQTAINSSVASCGVTWGFRPRKELEGFIPDYIVDKAEDILFLL